MHIISRARHIAALFNIEKLVRRIPFHFCAKQQQQQQQHLAIPNTATSQIYTKTITAHNNKNTTIAEQSMPQSVTNPRTGCK
jgi:hypothetical protein